jgi:hypothetical protein
LAGADLPAFGAGAVAVFGAEVLEDSAAYADSSAGAGAVVALAEHRFDESGVVSAGAVAASAGAEREHRTHEHI